MNNIVTNQITSRLKDARENVQAFLPSGAISESDAKRILGRYAAAIEGNFVSWMGAAAISARSVQGRYAASENLWVEMKDDHAGMLRSFVKSANAEPDLADFREVSEAVALVRKSVASMSGVSNIALMAFLENASAEFIPLLEKLASQCGATDLTYTKVHGEADVMHADQFAWALGFECEQDTDAVQKVDAVFVMAANFLQSIFVI